MNLLESFSRTTGIQPEKAQIYQKFFPLGFSDYIILNTQNEDQNSNYLFWSRVIDLISPFLKQRNIEVVQFVKNKKFEFNHTFVTDSTSLNEKTYLIKNCKLFCGSSVLYSLICSENDIPQCFLRSDYSVDNLLASEDEVIDSEEKRKGFLNPVGNLINNIRPEEVAAKIIEKLFPDESFTFNPSLYIGKVFAVKSIDLIPDCHFHVSKDSYSDEIFIRMDEHFSEANLEEQLKNCKACIVTDKPINPELLKRRKDRIKKVFFKIKQNSDASMLPVLEDLHIVFDLMTSLDDDELNKEKIKYLDYSRINKINKVDLSFLEEVDKSKVKYKTSKIIIKSGKMYASRSDILASKSCQKVRDVYHDLPDIISDSFREEADSFYFLTSEQI
jgi:hypothetical protein